MLTIVTAIIGFLGGFVPQFLKIWQDSKDKAHELALMNLQIEREKLIHTQKLEEVKVEGETRIAELEAQADIEEAKNLYQQPELKATGSKVMDFFLGALELYNSTVRPTVTYAFVGFYGFVKYAQFEVASTLTQNKWQIVKELYTEYDQATLTLVLSYYFGQRQARWVFGKFYK